MRKRLRKVELACARLEGWGRPRCGALMLRDASQRIWLVEATALVSRCDAPQHEGDSAPRIFGRGHGAYARSVGAKHQPVAV